MTVSIDFDYFLVTSIPLSTIYHDIEFAYLAIPF